MLCDLYKSDCVHCMSSEVHPMLCMSSQTYVCALCEARRSMHVLLELGRLPLCFACVMKLACALCALKQRHLHVRRAWQSQSPECKAMAPVCAGCQACEVLMQQATLATVTVPSQIIDASGIQ